MKNNILYYLGCLCSILTYGQLDTYRHKIELSGIKDQWHTIELPDTVFRNISQNINDLRVYGLTDNDTIEAPYLLKITSEKTFIKKVNFKTLNTVSNEKGYFFTYEIPTSEAINEILLNFKNENFDWKIRLEASQNQKDWFTILNDYRLLSIKNSQTNYNYTNLYFKDSKYRYYRLFIPSKEKPNILSSAIKMNAIKPATYKEYKIKQLSSKEIGKRTIIDIDLEQRLPLSYLKLNISDHIDYSRPFTLQYMLDSVKTEKGWRYNYRNLISGTLNSVEKNELKFSSILTQKLRVAIQNYDNEPLTVKSAETKGYLHKLITRFNKHADYCLVYGKANAMKPQYDIVQTAFNIPDDPAKLTLSEPKKIQKTIAPLFENKIWLWLVICIVIIVVGGSSLKMILKK